MHAITITQLYEHLASKLGKETAESMTSFIDHKINDGINDNSRVLATKQDLIQGLAAAKQDLIEGLASVRLEIAEVKLDLIGQISAIRLELTAKIGETRSEVIKWMFIFWTGQLVATFLLMQFFLKR
jgi:hypothetical protein